MLTHVAEHNSFHLAATISQSINFIPLYFETYESLRTKPVCGWSIIEEGGGAACGGYAHNYSCERFVGMGAFFCRPAPWSLNAPYAKHRRFHGVDDA